MGIVWTATTAILRPFARSAWAYRRINWEEIPRPTDEPIVTVPGEPTDRIVLVGDGPAMGYGVTSHSLALPGQLARQIASATKHGASVQVVADSTVGARHIATRFATGVDECDVAIVLLGGSDAARLTSTRAWITGLTALIEGASMLGAEVLIVAIPPISRMPVIRGPVAILAAHHAVVLNEQSQAVADTYQHVTFLPFDPPEEPDDDRYRSASTYREWAELIAPTVVRLLTTRVVRPHD